MAETRPSVTVKCPHPGCAGKLRATVEADGGLLEHTKPICESYEKVKTLSDAADLIAMARAQAEQAQGKLPS